MDEKDRRDFWRKSSAHPDNLRVDMERTKDLDKVIDKCLSPRGVKRMLKFYVEEAKEMNEFIALYRPLIDKFFQSERVNITYDREKYGHVWICEHEGFGVLTVEPLKGGQYEIAIRFPRCGGEEGWDKYSGYVAMDGYMVGRNTGGH